MQTKSFCMSKFFNFGTQPHPALPYEGRKFFIFLCAYFFLRFLSFFTLTHPTFQTILAAALILAFTVITLKKSSLGFIILIGEFLLDGNGHFFELFGVALRTWFVYTFLVLWFIDVIRQKKIREAFKLPKTLLFILAALDIAFCIGIINGISQGHNIRNIIQDFIPYTFLLLIFPARQYIGQLTSQSESKSQSLYQLTSKHLLTSYLVGSALFSLFTLTLFSTGISVIQSPYYKWFRDVAGGKITDVNDNFFRIVLPEHLLLVPILLLLLSPIIHGRRQWGTWGLVGVGLIPLTLNVSRTYVIAFLIGILFLYSRSYWKRWIKTSGITIIAFITVFSTAHFIATRGASFGWELYGARFAGITQPSSEISSANRRALLSPIFEKIKQNPVVGSGLGETITYIDPKTDLPMTTNQFDWGYLEIWTELGLLGIIATLSLIVYLLFNLSSRALVEGSVLRAATLALAFMQITTQAIWHVFGILLLVYALSTIAGDVKSKVESSA